MMSLIPKTRSLFVLRRTLTTTPRRLYADPWPLPHTPEHMASTTAASEGMSEAAIPPISREGEKVENTRARLVYQSRKRGTLECDLLLSTWATKQRLEGMNQEELKEYDQLLDEADWDIYYWCTGKKTPPERWQGSELLKVLSKHAKNEEKEVRRMPAL